MNEIVFPAALHPLVEQEFVVREFQHALSSCAGYRDIADRISVDTKIGKEATDTRPGLNPDTGDIEVFTVKVNHYAAIVDLNMAISRVGIASQFLQNASVNGEQTGRSLNELARNALFSSHFDGNTHVRAAPGFSNLPVDDIRGFQTVFVNKEKIPVGTLASLNVLVGSTEYQLVGVEIDLVNVSTRPWGVSGTLVFSDILTEECCSIGTSVVATTASVILRPNGRPTHRALTTTDQLTLDMLKQAFEVLDGNGVPKINGAYHCYLDPVSARQLFSDPAFRKLFKYAHSANDVFRQGIVSDKLDMRFFLVSEAFVQEHPLNPSALVHRTMVCGKGVLVEGNYTDMQTANVVPSDSRIDIVDGAAMVTRFKSDPHKPLVVQTWYWIGGFAAVQNSAAGPMVSMEPRNFKNSHYRRAVMIEHIG